MPSCLTCLKRQGIPNHSPFIEDFKIVMIVTMIMVVNTFKHYFKHIEMTKVYKVCIYSPQEQSCT